jgi:hypothetical protein
MATLTSNASSRTTNLLRFASIGAVSGCASALMLVALTSLRLSGPLHTLSTVGIRFLPGLTFGLAIAVATRRGGIDAVRFSAVCGVIYYVVVMSTVAWTFPGRELLWGGCGAAAVGVASNVQLHTQLPPRRLVIVGVVGAVASVIFLWLIDLRNPGLLTPTIAFAVWQSAVAAALSARPVVKYAAD